MKIIINKKNILEYGLGYAFILPGILLVIIFMAYPAIKSLILSFFEWKGYGEPEFIGLKNYINMFSKDRYFYIALKNTIFFVVATTFGTVVGGFILAVFIDLKIHFWKTYRFIFFLPITLSQVAVSLLWVKIFASNGLVNTLLEWLNLERLQQIWFGDPIKAMSIIVFVAVWQYIGFPMIFFLARMQNIDEQLYEAAKIDGASTIRRIISITIPLSKNVFSIITILQLIFSFKVFDVVWVMTGGQPARLTEVLGVHLYIDAFRTNKFGYGSVIAVVMFLISVIFSIIYIRVSGYQRGIKE